MDAEENLSNGTSQEPSVDVGNKYGKMFGQIAVDEFIATSASIDVITAWANGTVPISKLNVEYDGVISGHDSVEMIGNQIVVCADIGSDVNINGLKVSWAKQSGIKLFVGGKEESYIDEGETSSYTVPVESGEYKYADSVEGKTIIDIVIKKPRTVIVGDVEKQTLLADDNGTVRESTGNDVLEDKVEIVIKWLPRYYVFSQEELVDEVGVGVFTDELFTTLSKAMIGARIRVGEGELFTKESVEESVTTGLFEVVDGKFFINTKLNKLSEEENDYVIFAYPKQSGSLDGISFEKYLPVLPAFNDITGDITSHYVYSTKHRRAFWQGGDICFYGSVKQ